MAEIELEEVNVSQDALAGVGRVKLEEDQEDEGDEVEEGGEEREMEAGLGGGFDGLGGEVGVTGDVVGMGGGAGGSCGWFSLSVERDERWEGHFRYLD